MGGVDVGVRPPRGGCGPTSVGHDAPGVDSIHLVPDWQRIFKRLVLLIHDESVQASLIKFVELREYYKNA